jgi:hypothetical protein
LIAELAGPPTGGQLAHAFAVLFGWTVPFMPSPWRWPW